MSLKKHLDRLLTETTETTVPVRYEGSNICTWIGFKHVNYVVEEAVLQHFRRSGLAARDLYERHGLGLDLVDLDTRIFTALHMDDEVRASVIAREEADGELRFTVKLTVDRDGRRAKAVTSKVAVRLRRDTGTEDAEPAEALEPYTVGALTAQTELDLPPIDPAAGDIAAQAVAGRNAFAWKWRIPYMYCHFTERVQMSGYLRQMEEVVDLFLADRGISIKTLLDDRSWIPVVPHSRVRLLNEALMEEELYTVYTVEDVFKTATYTSRMDCFVVRDGAVVPVATGSIIHGYAVIDSRRDWSLVDFDDRVMRALTGGLAA
ncbi:hypothetical protein GCM10027447_37510 [Glycomyces halotolerans]